MTEASPAMGRGRSYAPAVSTERHSLRSNAAWMFLGQGTTWVLTALTLALLPRYLGPEHMGQLGIGLSFSSLGATVAGLGMATLITREVARDREDATRLLATAVWLNVIFGALAAAAAIYVGRAMGYGEEARLAILVNAVAIPFNLLISLGFGALQGVEVMRHQALIDAANKVFMLVALGVIVLFDLGFRAYLAVSFVSAIGCALPAVALMRRYLPFGYLSFSLRAARRLIVESLPFCTVGIVLVVYLAADVLLLSVLAGEEAVGIYAAPSRIFGTLLFAPTIIMTVVFPRMAAAQRREPSELRRIARTTLLVVTGVTLPVALLTGGAGRDLLARLIGGEYDGSGAVLAVMAIALIPTTVNMVAHRVLIAADRQRIWTAVIAGALVAKVVLDLALIPAADRLFDNAALGPAVAIVLVEGGMMLVAFRLMPHGLFDPLTQRTLQRLGVASLVTIAVLAAFHSAPFFVSGFAAAAAYGAAVLALGVYRVRDLIAGMRWMMGRERTVAMARALPTAEPLEQVLLRDWDRLKQVRPATRRG